jgi:hypothetical protein
MAVTNFSPLLGLALPTTGDLSGTWGTTVNDSITGLIDSAVAGTTNVSTDTDVTLSTTTGAANTARQTILLFSGARTALRTVTAPAQSKIYTVINATTGGFSVKLVGAGPTTGLTIPNGASAVVAWNGSDFVEIGAGSIGNLIVNGTLTVTGATTLQSTLAVTGNITNTAGTANGVTYLNGSKVLTSGSALVFDGTNLGIGASPAQTLHVKTSTAATPITLGVLSNSTTLPALSFNGAYASTTMAGTYSLTGSLYTTVPSGAAQYFSIADAIKLTLDSSGNLGLGVTPSAWISSLKSMQLNAQGVFAAGGTTNYMGVNWYVNSSSQNTYIGTGAATLYGQSGGAHQWFNAGSGTAGNAITFTQAMTLDADGDLGIGTSSPAYRLQVVTAATATRQDLTNISKTTGNWVRFTNPQFSTDASMGLLLRVFPDSDSRQGAGIIASGGATNNSTNLSLFVTGSDAVSFAAYTATPSGPNLDHTWNKSAGTSALELNSSGNLGLGVTPSAWQSGAKAFEVGGNGYLAFTGGTAGGYIYNNAYINTSGTNIYKATGFANALGVGPSGEFRFFNAPSGTAGNAITFTQAMTLDASGRLLVGRTSSDANGYFLQLNGTSGSQAGMLMTYAGVGSAAIWENSSGALVFGNDGASGATERARITSSGTLVIGATSGAGVLTLGGSGALQQYFITSSATSQDNAIISLCNNGASYSMQAFDALQFKFSTSGTERVRIDASGNLLLQSSASFETSYSGNGLVLSKHNVGAKNAIVSVADTSSVLLINNSAAGWDNVAIYTAGAEKARIDSNGIFLVGRTGADVGTNGFRADQSGSTYSSIATGNETNYVYSTSAAAYRFYVNAAGTVFATTTTISAISDIRFKENVRDLDAGLEKVMALKPRLYDWKEGKGADIKNARGFIAQEFETVFPDLIDEWKDPAPEGEEPYKSVRQDLIPVLVKAIQEQQAIIESLKARLDAANL